MTDKDAHLEDFFFELRREVGGDIRTDLYNRTLYSTDASLYQVMPLGVFVPRNSDEIQAAVGLAASYRIPILPRTAGTSLAGQTVNQALVIDVSRHMKQLLEINLEERWVRVQPGMVLDELNHTLKPHQLQFGPDPASSNRAGMGGIVGNNATGSHSILYGMAADHVLATQVVLSDGSLADFHPVESVLDQLRRPGRVGQIYRSLYQMITTQADIIRAGTPYHWRRSGGYNLDRFVDGIRATPYSRADGGLFNLAQILCGSEGTLGLMTELTLNLVPRPKMTALAIVHFDDVVTALDATGVILKTEPSAVEFLDRVSMNLCRTRPAYARLLNTFVEGRPDCLLVTEYYGKSEAELKGNLDGLRRQMQRENVKFGTIVPLLHPQQQSAVWQVRKAGLGLLMSKRGDYKPIPFIEDSAVPVEHLAGYITTLEQFCANLGTEMAYYAHASGGCLHVRPLINIKLADELAKLPQISRFAMELVKKYGGTWSSEHGDGRSRSWLNEQFFGPELFDLFRQVKHCFDPDNIFNPGNIVDPGLMTDNLRVGPDLQAIPLTENLDFSSDLGFYRAVEMCNGAGVCRKTISGTMCPSYMVTGEEEQSTRGRANMLRAALIGKIPAEELTSSRMYQVMDLCIACKACKTECPSSVDMAKIKLEFLGHYYEKHRTPLRARLFANINYFSHLGSGLQAPLINFLTSLSPVKWGLERYLGISQHRTLPQFARQPFSRWFKGHPAELVEPGEDRFKVVLFNDTFNTYNDPHIAIAATQVLEATGFEVVLPGHRCCGRPAMSKGLIKEARQFAEATIEKLYPLAKQGLPIVGLEPSCLLSLRDEYAALLPHDKRVDIIANQSYLFEEFIAKLADENRLKLEFEPDSRRVLLHGHCHQKALVGTESARRVLALPGYEVEEVDSGCCGMAGAFGYEVEHYDTSLAIGELRLFPAIRRQATTTIVAASGTSCREQIRDGTGRRAKHPAEILRDALVNQ